MNFFRFELIVEMITLIVELIVEVVNLIVELIVEMVNLTLFYLQIIVMVGLPARGKTYIAKKLTR